jgi:glucose-6-phosphate isomerase
MLAVTFTDLRSGRMAGSRVFEAAKTVGDLRNYWADPAAISDPGAVLYTTQTFLTDTEERPGIVLWGNTTLMPGLVGDEYHMTRGHRHVNRTHGELCITVSGTGALLLMDEERNTRMEEMSPGSAHWIDGRLAHRTVNTGAEPLVFFCAWPPDCGHDYEEIEQLGFSARLICVHGEPVLAAQ